jgi:serine/threonine protein kinase
MNRASFFFTVLSLLALASCTTTSQVSLDYVAGVGHIRPGSAEFVTRSFVDRRDMGSHNLGTVRTQIGTPLAMAPEILAGQRYDWKSDVWALGCVVWQLLAQQAEHTQHQKRNEANKWLIQLKQLKQ